MVVPRIWPQEKSVPAERAELHRNLIAPALPYLRGTDNLIIVPDRSMWQVPFAALAPRGGAELVQTHAITYAPSLMTYVEMRQKSKVRRDARLRLAGSAAAKKTKGTRLLVAMAYPVSNNIPPRASSENSRAGWDEALAQLAAAPGEVRAVASALGAPEPVKLDDSANEVFWRRTAPKATYLHFSVHGFHDEQYPMSSCVRLAPGGFSASELANSPDEKHADGILTAREIAQVKLPRTELAVLAACDTASGSTREGEGLRGLPTALAQAGVPSTMLSRWKAKRRIHRDFDERFLQAISSGRHAATD